MKHLGLVLLFFAANCLTGCKEQPTYNGYVDADLTYLSSDYPGRLDKLFVHRGQSVHPEQPLFTVEQTSERIATSSSRLTSKDLYTQEKVLREQIHYYQINYERTQTMRRDNAASQNDLDLAKEQLNIARDQLEGIRFQIQASELNTKNWLWKINRKQSQAPQPGIIFDTYFTPHEFVAAGQPIVSLITAEQIKLLFFVPETALTHLKLGQTIRASTDHIKDFATAEISYISNEAQYTPPIIYSRETREKLVFRVEARLKQPDLKTIHLGQPITIEPIQ